jgi:pyrroline-5-carboxylate reductase
VQIAIFGAGRIGTAIAHAVLKAGHAREALWVTTRSGLPTARTLDLPVATNVDAVKSANIALICTKPQDTGTLIAEIGEHISQETLVVSFVSGLTSAWFCERMGKDVPVIRVMTNLAIEVARGSSALSPNPYATRSQVEAVSTILALLGTTVEVPEDYLNAVSAISGGGIAYVYYLVEVMTQAAVAIGLPNDLARSLLVETVIGAGEVMRQTGRHPVQLREDVMSRGGQTIAGFYELERHNVRHAIFEAVAAARDRGVQLGAALEGQSQLHQGNLDRVSSKDRS